MDNTTNTPATEPVTGTPQAGLGNTDGAVNSAAQTNVPNQVNNTPEWFDKGKYGEFTPENVARQAADYHNAQKGMHQAFNERTAAERRAQELEEALKNIAPMNPNAGYYGNNVPPQYGNGVPQYPQNTPGFNVPSPLPPIPEHLKPMYEQIIPGMPAEQVAGFMAAVTIAAKNANAPLEERFANMDVERIKNDLRQRDRFFVDYEQDFDAILRTYPAQQRANPQVVGRVMNEARGRKLDTIFQKQLESASARPAVPGSLPTQQSTQQVSRPVEYAVPEDQIAKLVALGYDEAEIRNTYKK